MLARVAAAIVLMMFLNGLGAEVTNSFGTVLAKKVLIGSVNTNLNVEQAYSNHNERLIRVESGTSRWDNAYLISVDATNRLAFIEAYTSSWNNASSSSFVHSMWNENTNLFIRLENTSNVLMYSISHFYVPYAVITFSPDFNAFGTKPDQEEYVLPFNYFDGTHWGWTFDEGDWHFTGFEVAANVSPEIENDGYWIWDNGSFSGYPTVISTTTPDAGGQAYVDVVFDHYAETNLVKTLASQEEMTNRIAILESKKTTMLWSQYTNVIVQISSDSNLVMYTVVTNNHWKISGTFNGTISLEQLPRPIPNVLISDIPVTSESYASPQLATMEFGESVYFVTDLGWYGLGYAGFDPYNGTTFEDDRGYGEFVYLTFDDSVVTNYLKTFVAVGDSVTEVRLEPKINGVWSVVYSDGTNLFHRNTNNQTDQLTNH